MLRDIGPQCDFNNTNYTTLGVFRDGGGCRGRRVTVCILLDGDAFDSVGDYGLIRHPRFPDNHNSAGNNGGDSQRGGQFQKRNDLYWVGHAPLTGGSIAQDDRPVSRKQCCDCGVFQRLCVERSEDTVNAPMPTAAGFSLSFSSLAFGSETEPPIYSFC